MCERNGVLSFFFADPHETQHAVSPRAESAPPAASLGAESAHQIGPRADLMLLASTLPQPILLHVPAILGATVATLLVAGPGRFLNLTAPRNSFFPAAPHVLGRGHRFAP